MAVTAKLYTSFLCNALGSNSSGGSPNCDILSDTIKCSLHSAYTPNQNTHDFQNDVDGTEVAAGNNYSTGGATIGNKTLTYATGVITFKSTDNGGNGSVLWATSTISATQAVLYDSTPGSNTTNGLIGYIDFGGTVSSSSGNFQISWSSSGIFTITNS